MDILTWMKGSTPEQCREVALLILEQGTKERTAQWHANIDAAIAERSHFEIRNNGSYHPPEGGAQSSPVSKEQRDG